MTSRRVTIVASELLGRAGTGGAGTADSLLAVALARNGHEVQLLVASGREIGALSQKWTSIYDDAGVRIRVLDRLTGVRPSFLAPTFEVFHALRDDPPDVAIVNDWRGLGFASIRARQTGIALTDTAFVVHCHGPGRVLTTFAQKVPDTLERFGEQMTEQASFELADAVVSPTRWLLDWLRAHSWPVLAAARVIPYVRQSAALGEPIEQAKVEGAVRRLAFFGQLREGKGIRLFVDALAALNPKLLDGKELLFLGGARGRWAPDRVAAAIAPDLHGRLADIRFETSLDRDAVLAELRRPGTLAVMPSLLDNAPNTVSECIEAGVPFIATATGGIPELVADEDRARVLCAPTAEAVAAKLSEALSRLDGFASARSAHDAGESIHAWLDVIASVRPAPQGAERRATAVAVIASGDRAVERAHNVARTTRTIDAEVVMADTRRAGLSQTAAEWVVFLDEDDIPDDQMLDALVAAQAASGADVVTCAVRPADDPSGVQIFLGDAGAFGLVENQYGVVGLVRRSLVASAELPERGVDPDWPLFAKLALAGARVVSLPVPFAAHTARPGRVADVPGEGLAVLETFESADVPDLPQLAATLAAFSARRGRPPSVNGNRLGTNIVRRLAARVTDIGRRD